MDDLGKDNPDPERLQERNCSKQLQTYNVPTLMWKILTAQIKEGSY